MENNLQAKRTSKGISAAILGAGLLLGIVIGSVILLAHFRHQPATATAANNGLATFNGSNAAGSGGSSCAGQTLELNIGGQTVETCGQPTMGQATAISANSVTVQSQTNGQSKTFAIGSDTKISEHGVSKSSSDIQSGTTIVVIPSSDDPTQAAYIMINPSMVTPGSN